MGYTPKLKVRGTKESARGQIHAIAALQSFELNHAELLGQSTSINEDQVNRTQPVR